MPQLFLKHAAFRELRPLTLLHSGDFSKATLDQAAKPEELSAQSRAWLGANVKVVPYLFKSKVGKARGLASSQIFWFVWRFNLSLSFVTYPNQNPAPYLRNVTKAPL